MEGTQPLVIDETRRHRRRPRGWQRALGPALATLLLLLASHAVAPQFGLAYWTLLPVVVVALTVTGLLGSLLDAPADRFSGRLTAYAIAVAWLGRALALYAVGLFLFLGTIRLFQ
jgi:hypothetical protein